MADESTPEQLPGQMQLPLDLPSTPPVPAEPAPAAESDLVIELKRLVTRNREKYEALRSQGAIPDPVSVVLTRLETLLDLTLTPEQRLRVDLLFETRMSDALDQCLAQCRQAKLLSPLAQQRNPPNGFIVPGK